LKSVEIEERRLPVSTGLRCFAPRSTSYAALRTAAAAPAPTRPCEALMRPRSSMTWEASTLMPIAASSV
jgi:hypothetical protein